MDSKALQPGIHYGVTSEQYHAWALDKAELIKGPISCSMLKKFAPSPFAWRWGPEQKTSKAMQAGSLFDAALTEPDTLPKYEKPEMLEYIRLPFKDRRTKEAKEYCAKAEEDGVRVVTESEEKQIKLWHDQALKTYDAQVAIIDRAKLGAQRVREHVKAGPIVDNASHQVAVVGSIGEIPAKCLIDILPNDDSWDETIWDFKTTEGLDDESIAKTMGRFGYHWQAAFYRTMWNKASEDRHCERFGFIFLDRNTLEVRVLMLSDDDMDRGRRSVSIALRKFATAAHQGIKSEYADKIQTLGTLPYQAMNEEEWIEKNATGLPAQTTPIE